MCVKNVPLLERHILHIMNPIGFFERYDEDEEFFCSISTAIASFYANMLMVSFN